MATGINFNNQQLSALNHGYILNSILNKNGILDLQSKFSWTISGNAVTINSGIGVVQGRFFTNNSTTVNIEFANSGTERGYLIVKIDLGADDGDQVTIEAKQQANTLPSLVQQSFKTSPSSAIYEFPLFSYNATTTAISNVVDRRVLLTDGFNKDDVGLGNVQNYGIATQAQAEEGTLNNVLMTPLRVSNYVSNKSGYDLDVLSSTISGTLLEDATSSLTFTFPHNISDYIEIDIFLNDRDELREINNDIKYVPGNSDGFYSDTVYESSSRAHIYTRFVTGFVYIDAHTDVAITSITTNNRNLIFNIENKGNDTRSYNTTFKLYGRR